MISLQRFRDSRLMRGLAVLTLLGLGAELTVPSVSYALTGGPAQPEFSSFEPIGTSDLVNLSSGDFSYNIPLMDVGGYPLNLAYEGSPSMDQEASWVGLGWNLSVGQINRQVRGIPDDFKGDQITYRNHQKKNITIGGNVRVKPAIFGASVDKILTASFGMGLEYNSYTGFSVKPSSGISVRLGDLVTIGTNFESGPDGLVISPSLSLGKKKEIDDNRNRSLGLNFGTSFNSRQGLTSYNVSASVSSEQTLKDTDKNRSKVKNGNAFNTGGYSVGASMSLVNNTYTPHKRNAMDIQNYTFNGSFGTEVFGVEAELQITGYASYQDLARREKEKTERAFGYIHTELASKEDVLDFNREKDGVVTVNSTNLPLTNYTYDIYSVQGQGVSGMFRPYKSQVGYVYDPYVSDIGVGSSFGVELGAASTAHAGVDVKVSPSNSHSGVWENSNYSLNSFTHSDSEHAPDYEKTYFKNVGDLSSDKDQQIFFSTLQGYDPIRLSTADQLFMDRFNRYIKNTYVTKDGESHPIDEKPMRSHRQLRNQNVETFTKNQVTNFYASLGTYSPPVSPYAKGHHIAEVRVTRTDGARYVYGKALYNTKKKEVSFSVSGTGDCKTGLINYQSGGSNPDNSVKNKNGNEYYNSIETPPYAHTYLLTQVLSTDYQDIDGNGPSDNDLGSYTLFVYDHDPNTSGIQNTGGNYNWRIPFQQNKANYNEGLKTDPKDDQGNYVYGEKETAYIKEVVTKTHIAVFHVSDREDGIGAAGENGGIGSAKMQKLDSIQLFAKPEYNAGPGATPIKTVHFRYFGYDENGYNTSESQFELCHFDPSNGENAVSKGKLTLKKVFFTYRNSRLGEYTPYEFVYSEFNPNYNLKGYDIWGNYKPNESASCSPDAGQTPVPEFNYVSQGNRSEQDLWASAWSLKTILLPSGGKIDIDYEADDYLYVQNRRALQMFKVHGVGDTPYPVSTSEYDATMPNVHVNPNPYYLYVKLDTPMTEAEFRRKCINPVLGYKLFFRFLMNMTKPGGFIGGPLDQMDYVSGYCEIDQSALDNITVSTNGLYASVPVKAVELEGGGAFGSLYVNPISKAGWHFARNYLSEYAYSMTGLSTTQSFEGILTQMLGGTLLQNMLEVFQGANGRLKDNKVANRFVKDRSFIRLGVAADRKIGGGNRVKKVEMYDEWDVMTNNPVENNEESYLYKQKYGQEYSYVLEDGATSGVATYEPVGSKENPMVQPVYSVSVEKLLAPDEYNYTEAPFGESFFPSPTVTYSRVSVQNLERQRGSDKIVKKNATGKVVTEFYTSKDYPVITDQTELVANEDKTGFLGNLLSLDVKQYLTMTQGYSIHINDMNGKEKSQRVYAEGKDDFISGVDYLYETLSFEGGDPGQKVSNISGKLDNNVIVINKNGTVEKRLLGVEYDVINDFRENYSQTRVTGVDLNLAAMFFGFVPVVAPVPIPSYQKSSNQTRTVSTTKVINTFGILRETIAYDAGASVSTKNLAWDGVSGEVLVTETKNEYDDKYYTLNYPSHWYYKGMEQAATNSQASFGYTSSGTDFYMGGGYTATDYLTNGDQVWRIAFPSMVTTMGWVHNLPENGSGSVFQLLDKNGNVISGNGEQGFMYIARSGRKNLHMQPMANLTLMKNPLDPDGDGTLNHLSSNSFVTSAWDMYRIINAGAVEYSDDWRLVCECGLPEEGAVYNPYLYNRKGVWRAIQSWTYLTGRKGVGASSQTEPTQRTDGFFTKFRPFYRIAESGGNWEKNNQGWTFVSKVTQYSPYGFELENKDALHRYSAAQYGYNNTFPVAVGANTQYREIGVDNFEDYHFAGCPHDAHFKFTEGTTYSYPTDEKSHTGRYSLRVGPRGSMKMTKKVVECGNTNEQTQE